MDDSSCLVECVSGLETNDYFIYVSAGYIVFDYFYDCFVYKIPQRPKLHLEIVCFLLATAHTCNSFSMTYNRLKQQILTSAKLKPSVLGCLLDRRLK